MVLKNLVKNIFAQLPNVLSDKNKQLTNNCYFLDDGILSLDNPVGITRHPYDCDGMMLWAEQNGKISLNDGSFYLIPTSLEGETNAFAMFLGVKNGENYDPISLFEFNKNIYEKDVKRYTVFYPYFIVYIVQYKDIIYASRLCLSKQKRLLVDTCIINEGKEEKDVYSSMYLNFKFMQGNYDSVETKWFKQAKFDGENFKIYTVEDLSRKVHLIHHGALSRYVSEKGEFSNTTSRSVYANSKTGRIENSKALLTGEFEKEKLITQFSDMSCCGDLLKFKIKPSSSVTICYQLQMLEENEEISKIDSNFINEKFDELELNYKQLVNNKDFLKITFSGDDFINSYKLNSFLLKVMDQVNYCATTKNSTLTMLGVRDVFQAIEATSYYNKKIAREKILQICGYVDESGRFTRLIEIVPENRKTIGIDNREFIDQGFWPIDAIYNYLAFTGDYSILDEQIGYIKVKDPHSSIRLEKKSSLLQHIFDVMDFLISQIDEDTGCVKTLYGDWNDAIDGLGVSLNPNERFGNGVSIMATFQLYSCLIKVLEILEKAKADQKLINRYKTVLNSLIDSINKNAFVEKDSKYKILHGWGDNRSFFVGSFNDLDGKERDTTTSNAWYIISGFYKENNKYINSIKEAYKKLDSKYGIKTFEPFFDRDSERVGRIVNLPKGTAENAATYVHSSCFGIESLFRIGEDKWAWNELRKILPFTHSFVTTTPFVMPNSYVYNEELDCDGESMNDWYTGSSNTIIKLLVRSVFGLRPNLNELYIETIKDFPFDEAKVEVTIDNKRITLIHKKLNGTRKILMNDKPLDLIEKDNHLVAKIRKVDIPNNAIIDVID